MSIIYSYPEQGALNANDLLIGTSATKVSGKQKNITRNFSIQQIADFINRGVGFVDPVATDFQIPVFNQGGLKITGSIMSQDSSPSNGVAGTGITIAGTLTTTGSLTVGSGATIGDQVSNIVFDSPTKFLGPILDSGSVQGGVNQILISNQLGKVNWIDYEAGLTYEGTWDAAANTTNGQSNSPALVSGVGVSGHFYIVNVEGTTSLGPGLNDWHIGDWAVFLDQGGQPASWQKIDNTSTLVGSGTAGTLSKWTTPTTLNDSLVSEAGTVVSVNGDLKVKDTIQATTANTNLKLKGVGTGGVEIMSADGTTDGKIQLNCSNNNHGVTLQSPAHGSTVSYTLILPTSFGGPGDVLTSAGTNPSQLVWTTPTTGTVTNFTATSAITGITTAVTNPTTTPGLTLSITGTPGAGLFLDGTGNWSSPGGGVTDITATAPLNADVSTGSVTLSMPAYATATGGYVPIGGASGEYLDGLTGNWTSLPVSGVTSVTSANINTLTITTGNAPVITAVTTGGVGTGNDNLTTGDQVQTAIDTALAGAVTFKGTFDANLGSITGTSDFLYNPGANSNTVPIAIGDMYIVSTAGNFYGNTALNVGDEVIAIAAAAINTSAEAGWNAVPSAGAGVVSVLPSSTGLVSSGQPLVITPAGGTGTVTIESTAYAGQSNVGHVPAGGLAGQYLDGDAGSWLTLPASGVTSVSQGTPFASAGLPLLISPASGSVVISSAVYGGGSNIGVVPDGGTSADFLKGDGTWASAGGASTITTNNFSGNGTVGPFTLGATPSGGSTSFVDVFIDGVYQEIATYTVSGTALSFAVGSEPPTGTNIQTKTTSGNVSGALVQSVDIGQSSGNTGAVNLRIVPSVITSGQTILGNANSLYIFTSTTGSISTLTLPGSPTLGDSIKISNLGGLANVLGANGNKIMGVAADMTINTPTAAFELIWSGSNNGWIIIGNV
jgi:hypothetical protein